MYAVEQAGFVQTRHILIQQGAGLTNAFFEMARSLEGVSRVSVVRKDQGTWVSRDLPELNGRAAPDRRYHRRNQGRLTAKILQSIRRQNAHGLYWFRSPTRWLQRLGERLRDRSNCEDECSPSYRHDEFARPDWVRSNLGTGSAQIEKAKVLDFDSSRSSVCRSNPSMR